MLIVYNDESADALRAAGVAFAATGESLNKYIAMGTDSTLPPFLLKDWVGPDIDIVWLIGVCPRDPAWLHGMTCVFSTVKMLSLTRLGDEVVAHLQKQGLRRPSLHQIHRAASLYDMALSCFPGRPAPRLLTTDELLLSGLNRNVHTNPLLWTQLHTPLDEQLTAKLALIYAAIDWNMENAPIYWLHNHVGRLLCIEIPDPDIVNDIGPCWQRLAKALRSRYRFPHIAIGFKSVYLPEYTAFLFGPLAEYLYNELALDSWHERAICVSEKQWESWKRPVLLRL